MKSERGKEKGERRKEKGERRKEKGERRKENGKRSNGKTLSFSEISLDLLQIFRSSNISPES